MSHVLEGEHFALCLFIKPGETPWLRVLSLGGVSWMNNDLLNQFCHFIWVSRL